MLNFETLSKLQFDFEIIHKIDELKEITKDEILELAENAPKEMIFHIASRIRDERRGRNVSFSKKAFFNIINLCRDTCSYCTYKAEPNDEKLSMMNKQTVKDLAIMAKKYNCTNCIWLLDSRP